MPSTDPFYLVKDDMQASLDKAQTKYLQWQSAARGSAEQKRLEAEVDDECRSFLWQIEEMDKAVDAAENNMARFNLSQQEVASRRKWVTKTRQQCETIARGLKSPPAPGRRQDAGAGSASSKLGAAMGAENDRHIGAEQDQQQILLRQQDDDLDHLGEHVIRIGQMGRQIGEELGQQSSMIDELDGDIDGTTNRLAAAQKKMTHVLKKAGLRGQLSIIGILIVLLIILLLVAFS